jgi:hypothetical protein
MSDAAETLHPEAMTAGLECVLQAAEANPPAPVLLVLPVPVYTPWEDGAGTFSTSPEVDWGMLVDFGFDQVSRSPVVQRAVAEVDRCLPDLWRRHPPLPFGRSWDVAQRVFVAFCEVAARQLMADGSTQDDVAAERIAALDAIAQTHAFCRLTSFTIERVAPLTGVPVPDGEVHVTPTVSLSQATQADRDAYWRIFGEVPSRAGFGSVSSRTLDVAAITAVARTSVVVEAGEVEDWTGLQQATGRLVDVLRLLGPGQVHCLGQWNEFPTHPVFLRRLCATGIVGARQAWRNYRRDRVTTVRPDRLRELYGWHEVLSEWPSAQRLSFELALRRFNSTYDRNTDEDRLIDAWVAFEALFLEDTNNEATYRASMRVARLIGKTVDERVALVQRLKRSYDARSRVVHGAEPVSRRGVTFPERVDDTLEILRQALAIWLQPDVGRSGDALDRALLE